MNDTLILFLTNPIVCLCYLIIIICICYYHDDISDYFLKVLKKVMNKEQDGEGNTPYFIYYIQSKDRVNMYTLLQESFKNNVIIIGYRVDSEDNMTYLRLYGTSVDIITVLNELAIEKYDMVCDFAFKKYYRGKNNVIDVDILVSNTNMNDILSSLKYLDLKVKKIKDKKNKGIKIKLNGTYDIIEAFLLDLFLNSKIEIKKYEIEYE